MKKLYFADISFTGRGSVEIYVQPGESVDDLLKLSSEDLAARIINFAELADLVDDSDIDIDDIEEIKVEEDEKR